MHTWWKLVLSMVLLAWCGRAFTVDNPRQQLDSAIAEAIRILETGDHIQFVKTFLYPADLQSMLQDGSMDELVADFSDQFAERLLETLKTVRTQHPVISGTENEAIATFMLEPPVGGNAIIEFAKVGGYWYIKD